LIVPIDFLTKHCPPRRQAGFFVVFEQLPHLVEAGFELIPQSGDVGREEKAEDGGVVKTYLQ
jgi:hypothetical protein